MVSIRIILALLCLGCLFNMPYSYYEMFRVIAMPSFIYLAYKERNKKFWPLLWIISAILIQPFYKFYIVREIWAIIDIIWAVLLIYPYFNKLRKL